MISGFKFLIIIIRRIRKEAKRTRGDRREAEIKAKLKNTKEEIRIKKKNQRGSTRGKLIRVEKLIR